MSNPQTQTASVETPDEAREDDPHAGLDASEITEFDKEAAEAKVQEGKRNFERLFTQERETIPSYDAEPGLQTKELDQYAIGLGFLMSESIQKNPDMTYEKFLQSLTTTRSITSQFTQEITGVNANTEMGVYLNEHLPAYFEFVKGLTIELQKNKDNPGFLSDSVAWLQNQADDITNHPEGIAKGIVDKGAETGKNIFEFIKKNPKELAITAAVIGGVYLLKNFFFGKKQNAPSQGQESEGFWGFIKKTLKIGGIGALGAGLIAAIWKGPETIKKWLEEVFEKLKDKAQKEMEKKIKEPMIGALSVFMSEEEARKTVNGWFEDSESKNEEAGSSESGGNGDGEEEEEPSAFAEAAEQYSPEWLKDWWDETMKPNILSWLSKNNVKGDLATEALNQFDIVDLAKEYIKAGDGIIDKASRTAFVTTTGLMTAAFALFVLKKTIPLLVKNTFRIGKFAALKLFRHPIIAMFAGLGLVLGASSTKAQEVAEQELKKLFEEHERELLAEEKEFLRVVSEKTGIPTDYLEKVGGMRLKDFLSMGDNILKQAGEASGIFDYTEEWHTHFATLYDFLMEENRRDQLDGFFSGEIDRKMTVAGAMAIILGDSEIKEKSKRADEDQENIGIIEAGLEQAEFSVLHKGIADFVDALPEEVQEQIYEWDKENPNLRGTISRATKVFDIIAGNGLGAWFSAGMVILKKGAGIFVYPLALGEDLAKNIIGGEWEEVALDAAEGFAAMTTVKILTRNKIGYKTQLKPIAKIVTSITQGSRILPRIGIRIDTARLSLLNTRNQWSFLITEKSKQAEYRIMRKKLDFYIDEYDWWDKKRIKKPKQKFMDGIKDKIRKIFLEIQDFEVDNKIPKDMWLKENSYNEYREARKTARTRSSEAERSVRQKTPVVPEMTDFASEDGLTKAQARIGELEAKGTLDVAEKKQLAMLKAFAEGKLKTASPESVRSLPEAQRGAKLQEMAEELIEREKGFNARMRFDLDEIARHAEKSGLSMDSKEIRDMVEAVNKKIKTAARSKLKNIYALNKLYGELPKSAQTPELRSSLKNAMYTPGESLFLKFKKAAKGRAVMAAVMGGIMVGTKILTHEDDPEKSADEEIAATLAEMGPEAVQILVDILPFVGTYSTARAAVTGEEWVTDRDVSSFGDRTMNTLFSIAGGAADVFTVATFGTGAAANLAARAGVLTAKMGARGPKILNAVQSVIPKLTRIADKIGWKNFAEKFVNVLKTGLNPARMQKIAGAAAIAGTTVMVGNVTMGMLYVNEGEIDPDEIHADLQPE